MKAVHLTPPNLVTSIPVINMNHDAVQKNSIETPLTDATDSSLDLTRDDENPWLVARTKKY